MIKRITMYVGTICATALLIWGMYVIILGLAYDNIQSQKRDVKGLSSLFEPVQPYTITITRNEIGTVYRVYLSDSIGKPNSYVGLLDELRGASSTDTIIVYLNGYGGSVNGGLRLTTALNNSAATVVTHVDGNVYSMHAMLTCIGDKKRIASGTHLMFHSYSSGFSGKGSDVTKFYKASDDQFKKYLEDYCKPILTDEDIANILDGKDVYISAEVANHRLLKSKHKGKSE